MRYILVLASACVTVASTSARAVDTEVPDTKASTAIERVLVCDYESAPSKWSACKIVCTNSTFSTSIPVRYVFFYKPAVGTQHTLLGIQGFSGTPPIWSTYLIGPEVSCRFENLREPNTRSRSE